MPRTRTRRAIYALLGIAVVLVVGTVGFHAIAGLGWVDAFYFESMLATGQGPPLVLTTDASKLFASLMAFISVGSVVSAILLTLGPIIIQLWRETVELVEQETREIEREILGKGPRP